MVEPHVQTALFGDPKLQQQFDDCGFVMVPLLDTAGVGALTDVWHAHDDPKKTLSLSTTIFSPSIAYRQAISAGICAIVEPRIAQIMPDARLVYGSFVVKQAADERSPMPIHQDSSYVDESLYAAATLWIPVIDIDETNGAVHVVPGSHKLNRRPRPFGSSPPYEEIEDDFRAAAIPLYPRAGTALIFSQMIFHFSPPNRSAQIRIAGGGVVAQKGAPATFLWETSDGRVDVYQVEDAFFHSFSPSVAPPNRTPVTTISAGYESCDRTRALETIAAAKRALSTAGG
jgi:hypothetical protein